MSETKKWNYKSLEIGLAVSDCGDAEVVIKDCENETQTNLVFDNLGVDISGDKINEIVSEIGLEVYAWLMVMFDQLDEEDDADV